MGGLNLDLSGASESSFEALPSAWYNATIFDVEMRATKGGPEAKLPAGTPMMAVQFRIADGEYENRRVFTQFVIAPAKIVDKDTNKKVDNPNKGTSDGILYGFLKAVGFDPDEIKSGNFNLDFDEMKGRALRIKLGQREYNGNIQNEVKGTKAAGEDTQSADDLALLS